VTSARQVINIGPANGEKAVTSLMFGQKMKGGLTRQLMPDHPRASHKYQNLSRSRFFSGNGSGTESLSNNIMVTARILADYYGNASISGDRQTDNNESKVARRQSRAPAARSKNLMLAQLNAQRAGTPHARVTRRSRLLTSS